MNYHYKKRAEQGTYDIYSEEGELLGVLTAIKEHGALDDLGNEGYLCSCDSPAFYILQYDHIRICAEEEGKVAPDEEQCAGIAYMFCKFSYPDCRDDIINAINDYGLADAHETQPSVSNESEVTEGSTERASNDEDLAEE